MTSISRSACWASKNVAMNPRAPTSKNAFSATRRLLYAVAQSPGLRGIEGGPFCD
jgi:hypothetical protein